MNMKKKTCRVLLLSVLAVLLVGGGAVGYMLWDSLFRQPVVPAQGMWVYIHDGEVEPADALDAPALHWALDYYDFEPKLAEGRLDGAYHFEGTSSAMTVARRITRHQQTAVKVSFNNIRLKEQWAGRVAQKLMCDSLDLLQAMTDTAFLRLSGMDEANVISVLLPDTYEVYWNTPASELMARMLKEYNRFWNEERRAKAEALGMTPREVSVLCSIAEEETNNRQERGVVARLYWNRLQRGMLLQADPTVKFALGDFGLKRILLRHLEVDSPYNTYKNEGLPPGPLRMVEKATIDAFLNSTAHEYLYMCAKPELNGLHNFAKTLSEHNRNAEAYHQAIRKL